MKKNGRVTPVTGIKPVTTHKFNKACTRLPILIS